MVMDISSPYNLAYRSRIPYSVSCPTRAECTLTRYFLVAYVLKVWWSWRTCSPVSLFTLSLLVIGP